MGISDFERRQQLAERILAYVDSLMEQGKRRSEAVDHAFQRFGRPRSEIVRLLNERDYGLLGTSGHTEISVCATDDGLRGIV